MSTIAGIYQLDEEVIDRALVQRMADCLRHRSFAPARIWTNGFVGLGHGNSITTQQSRCAIREIQPVTNQLGHCWLTFDGRIDNRDELSRKLKRNLSDASDPTDC